MTLTAQQIKMPIGWHYAAKEKTTVMKKVRDLLEDEWRQEVIRSVTDLVLRLMTALDDGSERSLVSMVNDLYFAQGYAWVYSEQLGRFMLTRDAGSSFLITDDDLEDILEQVMNRCYRQGIVLENTRKTGLCYTDTYRISKAA
ncbi:MAG: hypothetical protein Q4C54_04805 [Clostridia bacterium]|nr:hypothetical protein [Clostridia bacterium]